MKNSPSKIALAAGILLVLAFTISCSSGSDDNGGTSSQSGGDNGSSSSATSGEGGSSSSVASGGDGSDNGSSSSATSGEGGSSSSVASGGDSSSSGGGQGVPFNENSQIYNRYYDDDGWYIGDAYNGSGIIKLVTYGEDHEVLINAGSVTDGIVRLELPPTIPDEYFKSLFDEDEQSYCTDYPTDIKVAVLDYFKLFNSNGELLGSLNIEYRDKQIREYIEYWYFTKAGKITCDFGSAILKMDAKVGLNKTYYHRSYVGNSIIERSTTSNVTKVKWVIRID
jgi:hypothetical protein